MTPDARANMFLFPLGGHRPPLQKQGTEKAFPGGCRSAIGPMAATSERLLFRQQLFHLLAAKARDESVVAQAGREELALAGLYSDVNDTDESQDAERKSTGSHMEQKKDRSGRSWPQLQQ
jgi:hypothetical protein